MSRKPSNVEVEKKIKFYSRSESIYLLLFFVVATFSRIYFSMNYESLIMNWVVDVIIGFIGIVLNDVNIVFKIRNLGRNDFCQKKKIIIWWISLWQFLNSAIFHCTSTFSSSCWHLFVFPYHYRISSRGQCKLATPSEKRLNSYCWANGLTRTTRRNLVFD